MNNKAEWIGFRAKTNCNFFQISDKFHCTHKVYGSVSLHSTINIFVLLFCFVNSHYIYCCLLRVSFLFTVSPLCVLSPVDTVHTDDEGMHMCLITVSILAVSAIVWTDRSCQSSTVGEAVTGYILPLIIYLSPPRLPNIFCCFRAGLPLSLAYTARTDFPLIRDKGTE